MPPCKRSAVKDNTSTRRQAATSQVERKRNVFTSDQRERLHPPSHKATVDKQVSLLCGLVKMSRLHCITPWQGRKPSVLSEELLLAQKREEKTCGDLRHFFAFQKCFSGIAFISFRLSRIFGKKNGGESEIRTHGGLPHGGFQDRCLKPLDHLSAKYLK